MRYVRIPAAYTDPITVAWALDCTWPGKDGEGSIKVPCTETMRAAYEASVAQCNADRAAVRDLSDRAEKRSAEKFDGKR